MSPRRISRVRKRDGRVVDYDEQRLAEGIYRAACSAGKDNRYLADDLAGVVTMYLDRYYGGDLPESSEIRRMVEKILSETGHADIAGAFASHVVSPDDAFQRAPSTEGDLFPENRLLVEGSTRDEVSTWGRERITQALVREAGLEAADAEEVAAVVERRIFMMGKPKVSSQEIRDLVNHELMLRGYGAQVPRQFVVGLPKYDLARLLEPGQPDADDLVRTIGRTTLKQYALQEIFSREVADAHLEGRIHIHNLEQPLKAAWRGVGPEDLPSLPGLPEMEPRTWTARIASGMKVLGRRVVDLELLGLNRFYADVPEGRATEEAAHLLLSLEGWVPGIDLSRTDAFPLAFLQAARAYGWRKERVIETDVGGHEALSESCRQAAEGAPTLFLLARDAGERRSRLGVEGGLLQTVTINLPQVFFRNETDFYAELETSLDFAVRAHVEKRRLLQRSETEEPDGGYAVGLAGLSELVRLIGGKTPDRDDGALKLALRIVSYLYFRVREEAAKYRLPVTLEDLPARRARERFLRVDRRLHPRARGLDVAEYAPGYHLVGGSAQRRLEAESRFHTLFPSGRVLLPVEDRNGAELEVFLKRAWENTLARQIQFFIS